jgi:TetR/AcrR family transcriptional regulator
MNNKTRGGVRQAPLPRKAQRDASRARILSAALKVFATKGFDGAGTREIAEAAGVRQGLIGHYFASKEALWKEAVATLFSDLAARMAAIGGSAHDFEGRFREGIRVYVRFCAERPEHARIMQHAGTQRGPLLTWLVETHVRSAYDQLQRVLARAKRAGLAPAVRGPLLHYILNGAAQSVYALEPEARLLTGEDVTAPKWVEEHADALADLLLAPRAVKTKQRHGD